MDWTLDLTRTFKKGYKNKSTIDQERVKKALADLKFSENPRAKGKLKHTLGAPAYAYEIGDKYRLLYEVDDTSKILKMRRVCSHEEVYR